MLRLERKVPPQGEALRAWFDAVRHAFEGRILPFTAEAAVRCASMHVPDPKGYRDSMIAATALVHGFFSFSASVAMLQLIRLFIHDILKCLDWHDGYFC